MKAPFHLHLRWALKAAGKVFWEIFQTFLIITAICLFIWFFMELITRLSSAYALTIGITVTVLAVLAILGLVWWLDLYFQAKEKWEREQAYARLRERNTVPEVSSVRPLHGAMVPNPNRERDVDTH